MYEEGQGVSADESVSIKYYERAAQKGFTDAQILLGDFYKNRHWENVVLNITQKQKNPNITNNQNELQQAMNFYRSAALNGSPIAQYEFAKIISQKKVTHEYELAVKLLISAANQNYVDAIYELARVYEKGLLGIIKNNEMAQKYYDVAAKHGHKNAKQHAKTMLD
jgi:TPR repeat protein